MRITKDTKWTGKLRRLGGTLTVEKGATLTIEDSMLFLYSRTLKVYGNLVVRDSTLKMPYIELAYGFGGDKVGDETNNGNITIEDSFIDVACFYGFFNRESTVTLKNSIFTGFGRVAGENSIVYNCTFLEAHDRYGSIATYGQVKEINFNTVIGDTSLYYNPDLSEDCLIENMLITGKKLAYLEPGADYTLTLVDCEIMHRDVIDNGFEGQIDICHRINVSGELVRDDGHVYTGESCVAVSTYRNGQWRDYTYTILDKPIAIDGNSKFVNPSLAMTDGYVEASDMVGENFIVDLVPIDKSIAPSANCPYCASRLFFPKAYALNDRWYQNRCRECKDYSVLDTEDGLMYALRDEAVKHGLLKGKPDQ